MEIGDFTPGTGYRVFVPFAELARFYYFAAQLSRKEREQFNLNGQEHKVADGSVFFLGKDRAPDEMEQFQLLWALSIND